MKTVNFKVSKEVIQEARLDMDASLDVCTRCMLARTIREAGYPDAAVFLTTVWLDGTQKTEVKLSPRAIEQRKRFDQGKPIQPFYFRLRVPSKTK